MDQPDPITLAVVSGTLDSAIREMTITVKRTAMSPVLAIGNDFSNAIFDSEARMVYQGWDQPVHLGAMIGAAKGVAHYFGDDLAPGDVIYHNDPKTNGSHLQDMTMFKPLFFEGELLFWTVNRSHMNETGGPVAGGYNPLAEEIWAEGVRIPPVKLVAAGARRQDVIDLLATNFRTRTEFYGDIGAQLAATTVAERRLVRLLEHYGTDTIKASLNALLDGAEERMRAEIRAMPDGVYTGCAMIEDDGHGSGDMELRATLLIEDEEMHITYDSPPMVRSYINSYEANSMGGVYLGVITFTDPEIPHNEGMYRPIDVDLGPKGTLINATEPAACGLSTSVPYIHLAEAARDALGKALPERAGGGWGKVCMNGFTGIDPRYDHHYGYIMQMTSQGGGGAFWGQDGEMAVGPLEIAGAALIGDVEVIEHMMPLHIHRSQLDPDSAGAGRWRGGWGMTMAIGPVDHTAELSSFGDGMKYPPPSVRGARSPRNSEHVFHKYIVGANGKKKISLHSVNEVTSDQHVEIHCAGGGGVGNPLERDPQAVLEDVRSGLLSVKNARDDFGVVVDEISVTIDSPATTALRQVQSDSEEPQESPHRELKHVAA